MARVLLQSLVFPPDGVSTADIMGMLALGLERLGHDVTVVTTTPHYNNDPQSLASQQLHRGAAGFWYRSEFHGIPVHHIAMYAGRGSGIGRVLGYLWFHAVAFFLAFRMRRNIDVLLVSSPPPTAGWAGALTARLMRVPFVYNVQEVFPDALVHLGLIRADGVAARLIAWAERFAYRRADAVVAVSRDFADRLRERGARRLEIVPNFVDVERLAPLPRIGTAFAREHGLDQTFNVVYAGNFGMSQDWTGVLDAAEQLVDVPAIRFLLIGGGVEAARVSAMVADRKLPNVTILPYQPADRVPELYALSDLCLIPMRPHLDFDTLPSKIYSIMASARPALVFAHPDCEAASLVAGVRCGIVVPRSEGGAALAAAIRAAVHDRQELAAMGERGRAHVVSEYAWPVVVKSYDRVLAQVARN